VKRKENLTLLDIDWGKNIRVNIRGDMKVVDWTGWVRGMLQLRAI
jgi:hypothetical protein